MTDQEKKEMIQMVATTMAANQKHVPDLSKIVDWLFKALIALLVWQGLDAKGTLEEVSDKVTKLEISDQVAKKDTEDFRAYINQPRFTREQYQMEAQPTINQVNRNTNEINEIKNNVLDNDNQLRELKFITTQNSSQLSEILAIIKADGK